MFSKTIKIDGLSHPLISSAYFKKDYWGNTLIIDTNFSNENKDLRDAGLNILLGDLKELIDHIESNVVHFDTIDIRLNTIYA
jgi:hypothetical protein